MPDQRVLVHTSLQPVRWGDMDMLGHVNDTVYFRYMEQARIEWVHALAQGPGYDDGQGLVIASASGRPVPLPESVRTPVQGRAS